MTQKQIRTPNVHAEQAVVRREWLTDVDLEQMTGRSRKTWRKDRLFGRGPRFRKLGGSVRYHITDVEAWIKGCPSGGDPAEVA